MVKGCEHRNSKREDGSMRYPLRSRGKSLGIAVIGLFALVALVALAGPALAGGRGTTSVGRDSAAAAAATNVKILASKSLKLKATAAGKTGALATVGPISARTVCKNTGSNVFENALQFKSTAAGTVLEGPNGSSKLTSSFKTVFSVLNGSGYGFAVQVDILTPSGAFQHWNLAFNVHQLGGDCMTRIAVTNA
jgi:hypothetical protein